MAYGMVESAKYIEEILFRGKPDGTLYCHIVQNEIAVLPDGSPMLKPDGEILVLERGVAKSFEEAGVTLPDVISGINLVSIYTMRTLESKIEEQNKLIEELRGMIGVLNEQVLVSEGNPARTIKTMD